MTRNIAGFGMLVADGHPLGQVRYDLDVIVEHRLIRGMISANSNLLTTADELGAIELAVDTEHVLSLRIENIYDGVAAVSAYEQ